MQRSEGPNQASYSFIRSRLWLAGHPDHTADARRIDCLVALQDEMFPFF
jgi:hypothetical protein